jgi:hypothetical protein
MEIRKIVALAIPITALAIWVYLFSVFTEVNINRFVLVIVLIPLALGTFFIAIKLWQHPVTLWRPKAKKPLKPI